MAVVGLCALYKSVNSLKEKLLLLRMFRIYEAVLLFDFLPGVSHRVTMSRYSVALKMKCRHTGTAPTEHFEAEADLAPNDTGQISYNFARQIIENNS
jgi:hypothetical protein